LPIPKNVSKEQETVIIKHVELLLQLHKDLKTAVLPNQVEQLKQKISYNEKQIDKLVYELYGLTEEEIEIIEKK